MSLLGRDALIVDAVRTPRGRGRPIGVPRAGSLAGVHPQELVVAVLHAIAQRTGISPHTIDDVVLGCVSQVDEQGANIARHAVLSAHWPYEVPATTLTRACGSGLQALHYAVMGVMSGAQDAVVAGGVESMSRVPMGSDGASAARRDDAGDGAGNGAPASDAMKGGGVGDGRNPRLRARLRQVPQGISADLIATGEGIAREEIDAFALRSQERAAAAVAGGHFARSIVPVCDAESGALLLGADETPRDTTAAALASLPASFAQIGASGTPISRDDDALAQLRAHVADGVTRNMPRLHGATRIEHVHTAGNSSGLSDGAAALLVTSADYARTHDLTPRARVRAMGLAGSDPVLMLTAPTPASERALAAAGMHVRDIDLWEINEAFGVVPIKTMRDLGIDPERVNVNGGAIALGHPLGATGAILVATALDELERRGLATALVTLCIAGGQGIAAVIERV